MYEIKDTICVYYTKIKFEANHAITLSTMVLSDDSSIDFATCYKTFLFQNLRHISLGFVKIRAVLFTFHNWKEGNCRPRLIGNLSMEYL